MYGYDSRIVYMSCVCFFFHLPLLQKSCMLIKIDNGTLAIASALYNRYFLPLNTQNIPLKRRSASIYIRPSHSSASNKTILQILAQLFPLRKNKLNQNYQILIVFVNRSCGCCLYLQKQQFLIHNIITIWQIFLKRSSVGLKKRLV